MRAARRRARAVVGLDTEGFPGRAWLTAHRSLPGACSAVLAPRACSARMMAPQGAPALIHAGLLLALRQVWDARLLDAGPYSTHFVLVVASVAHAPRALTLAAVAWFSDALASFAAGGRCPALVDRWGLPTLAGRAAGLPWPSWLDDPSSPLDSP